jgi:hypothetical protein
MIKVKISVNNIGSVIAVPISESNRTAYAEHLREYESEHADGSAFFQNEWGVPETITSHRNWKDCLDGWDFTMLVDPWEFGHWLGWDAHNVELGASK